MNDRKNQIAALIKVAMGNPSQAASVIRTQDVRSGFVPDEEIDLYVQLADLVISESPEFACGAYIWYLIHFRMSKVCNKEKAERSANLAYELISANRSFGDESFEGWSIVLARHAFPKAYWWNDFLSDFFEYAKDVVFEGRIALNDGRRGHWFAIVALNADDQPDLKEQATRSFIGWAESKLCTGSDPANIGWHLQNLTESAASASCELMYKCGIDLDKDQRRSPLAEIADDIFWKYVELFVNKDCKPFLSTMFYGLSSGSISVFEKSRRELMTSFDWVSSDCFEQAESLLGTLYSMSYTTYSYRGPQDAIKGIYSEWNGYLDKCDPGGTERRAKLISEIRVGPW